MVEESLKELRRKTEVGEEGEVAEDRKAREEEKTTAQQKKPTAKRRRQEQAPAKV